MLLELVKELEGLTPTRREKQETERMRQIRQKYEQMDERYWTERVKKICRQNGNFNPDSARYELWKERTAAEFLKDELLYQSYEKILREPKKMNQILRETGEQTAEYDRLLEFLDGIEKGIQQELDGGAQWE